MEETIEELMRSAITEVLFGIKSPFYGKGIVEEVAVEQMKVALQSQTQDIKKKINAMRKDYENKEINKDGFCQECSYLQCKCLGYNKALSNILEDLDK